MAQTKTITQIGETTRNYGGRGRVYNDPYLKRVTTTQMRGKDMGMSNVKVSSVAKQTFQLDEERAKDARNWEYWYKREHGTKSVGGTYTRWVGGKGGEQKTFSNQSKAIEEAKREAKRSGQDVYEIEQIQAETRAIKQRAARAQRAAIGGRKFGSTRAAAAVAASKQASQRRTLGAQEKAGGTGTGVFGTSTANELRARRIA